MATTVNLIQIDAKRGTASDRDAVSARAGHLDCGGIRARESLTPGVYGGPYSPEFHQMRSHIYGALANHKPRIYSEW